MGPTEPSTIPAFSLEEKPAFRPSQAHDFDSAGLNVAQVEGLVLKFLLGFGVASGRRIADELGMPFGPFPEFLRQLKNQQILSYTNSAAANDYYYALTDAGRACAKVYFDECAYVGTAPVTFSDYVESVAAQTINNEHPKMADLRRAFSDLLIDPAMLQNLGAAINSGRGMFIYGFPGNGKTSIAERITKCFGETIWIPRVIAIEGQILKLYDPANHEADPPERGGLLRTDEQDDRWVEIRRPTIIAGGELTMDNLEIRYNPETKISEAPLQMKSNNGCFLIDDFGRQRMPPIELAEPLDHPSGEAVRLPVAVQRQEDPRPVRPAHPVLDQSPAQGPGRRGVPPPHPVQDQRDRPDRGDVPPDVRDLRPQARLPRDRAGDARLPDRAPLPPRQPAVPELPAPRPPAPDPQPLRLQRAPAGAHARILRRRRRQLLHRHVSPVAGTHRRMHRPARFGTRVAIMLRLGGKNLRILRSHERKGVEMPATTGANPISDLMYDWLTVLQSKAEGLNAYEKYIKDAEKENASECVTMFRKLHEHDAQQVREIKDHLMKMMTKQGK